MEPPDALGKLRPRRALEVIEGDLAPSEQLGGLSRVVDG